MKRIATRPRGRCSSCLGGLRRGAGQDAWTPRSARSGPTTNGMTLYTFDKDTKGATKSACVDKCIENWPPFLAAAGAMAEGDWTIVDVVDKDGATKKMWAYDGWPLYLWVKDTKPGDVTGDGVGGVWHVVKAD